MHSSGSRLCRYARLQRPPRIITCLLSSLLIAVAYADALAEQAAAVTPGAAPPRPSTSKAVAAGPAGVMPRPTALALQAEADRVDALKAMLPSVVAIFARADQEGGGGSGVLISPEGLGLSNFHVVADFLDSRRGFGALADGRIYPLHVLGIDPGGDIVLFQLEGRRDFQPAILGDSDRLRIGMPVAAIGNPFLLAEDYVPTISVGIISGLHRYQEGQGNLLEYADCIQVSTSINPGNSGGPLFDLRGPLIGINGRASFEERGRVNVGLGYAVTINQIKRFLPGLRAGLLCEHGTLGATVSAAGDSLVFNAIQDFSPAEKAGIQLGDELLAVNDRPLRTPNDFNNVISILPANWPTRLTIRRAGQTHTLTARLERLPAKLEGQYLPERAVNVAEQRRILERYAEAELGVTWRAWSAGGATRTDVTAILREAVTGAAKPDATTAPAEAPKAGARAGEGDVAARVHDANTRAAAAGPQAAQAPKPSLDDIVALLQPLWRGDLLEGETRAIGGDECAGRLVAVIERQTPGGRRLRWKFDWDSGEWLAGASGDEQEPERMLIELNGRVTRDGARLPARWKITAAGAAPVEIELAAEGVK